MCVIFVVILTAILVTILVIVKNGKEFACKDLFRTPILSKQMYI